MARPFLCQTSSDRAPPCPFKPLFFRHAAARRFFFFFFCLRQIAFHLPNINLRNLLPSSDSATRERDSFADNTGQPSRAFNFKSQKISPLCFSRLFFSSFFSFFLFFSPPPHSNDYAIRNISPYRPWLDVDGIEQIYSQLSSVVHLRTLRTNNDDEFSRFKVTSV